MARALVRKASGDEGVLAKLHADPNTPDEILGFHAQQAVAKQIKAVLAGAGVEHPRTHDIDRLLELLAEAGIQPPPGADSLDALTPWAAAFRYEDTSTETLDRLATVELVAEVRSWAAERLG